MYTNVIVGITISRGSFVASPLNTVAKRDSDERRVIVDLSWLCGTSVNDGIP